MALLLSLVCIWTIIQPAMLQPVPIRYPWNQRYGNNFSTNYVDVPFNLYTAHGSIALFTNLSNDHQTYDPAVSRKGVLYLPLVQVDVGASVAAITAQSTVLWKMQLDSEKPCSTITNVVFSEKHQLVVTACGWSSDSDLTHSMIVALKADGGKVQWSTKMPLGRNSKLISLSDDTDTVNYFAEKSGTGAGVCVLHLNLTDGRILSSDSDRLCDTQQSGFIDAKLGYVITQPEFDHKELLITSLYDENSIVGFSDLTTSVKPRWITQLPKKDNLTTLFLGFAFTTDDVQTIFVSASFVPLNAGTSGGYSYFIGIDALGGEVLFNHTAYCDSPSAVISSPVVNYAWQAFFSCGDQVFSVYPYGGLIWKSEILISKYEGSYPPLPISLDVPRGLVYSVIGPTTIAVLDMKSGATKFIANDFEALNSSYIVHPPILLRDAGAYVIHQTGREYLTAFFWSGHAD